jgi:PAS domain S-box-containing protein
MDGRYLLVNPAWSKFHDLTNEAVGGRRLSEFCSEDVVAPFDELVQAVIESGKAIRKEVSFPHADGNHSFISIKFPIPNAQGQMVNIGSISTDITERKQAEEEIRELNAGLERRVEERTAELRAAQAELLRQERLATLGQLTATVSHELRNPLGVIRTSVFVVRDGLDEAPARVARSLERIERSVIRCDRIIDEMLDFTRISDLEFEMVPIDTWLAGVLEEQVVPRGGDRA